MQDKKENFSTEFIDASWNKLAQQLDSSMPAPRISGKDKWIYILSALSLLLLLTTLKLAWDINHTIPTTIVTKEKIVYKYIESKESSSSQKDLASQIIENNTKQTVSISNRTPLVLRQWSLPLFQVNKYSLPTFNEYSRNERVIQKRSSVQESIAQIPQLESLSTVVTSDADDLMYPSTFASGLYNDKIVKRSVRFSVGAAGMVTNNLDFSGHEFIAGVNLPFGSKFSINTGIGLDFFTRDYYVIPGIDRDIPLPKSQLGVINITIPATFYDGLRSFKQVTVPINVEYELTKHVAINTGLKYRHTFSEEIYEGLLAPIRTRIREIENPSSVFFTSANIGLTGGLAINTNKFRITVESEWGLGSLIDKSLLSNPGNIRYDLNLLNVGLHYRF